MAYMKFIVPFVLTFLMISKTSYSNGLGMCLTDLISLIESKRYDYYVEINSIHQRWSGAYLRIRSEMEKAQKITPSSHIWSTDKVKHYHSKGRILTAVKRRDLDDYNETGIITDFINTYPGVAKKFGLTTYKSQDFVYVKYPDPMALEAIIDNLYKIKDPWRPSLRFRSFNGKEASSERFAKNWINGRMIISNDGYYHYHDVMIHMIGYLIMPRNILMASRMKFQLIRSVMQHPQVIASEKYYKLAKSWLAETVTELDSVGHFFIQYTLNKDVKKLSFSFSSLTSLNTAPKELLDNVEYVRQQIIHYENALKRNQIYPVDEALGLLEKLRTKS